MSMEENNQLYDYSPDQWQLVKITGTDPHYRVFGSWSGGYLDGDCWRLNSGIIRCESIGDCYFFYGNTGSVYKCHKENYGIRSPYNLDVLTAICKKSQGTAEVVDEMPDVMNMEFVNESKIRQVPK